MEYIQDYDEQASEFVKEIDRMIRTCKDNKATD